MLLCFISDRIATCVDDRVRGYCANTSRGKKVDFFALKFSLGINTEKGSIDETSGRTSAYLDISSEY